MNQLSPFFSWRSVLAATIAAPLVWVASAGMAYAEPAVEKISLDSVTVYLRGAELFSSGSVRLPAGESEIVFTNVAGNINEQSLSVAASNGVMVLSSSVRSDYLVEEALSPQAQKLQDELDAARRERDGLQIQLDVIKEQLAVLQANRELASADGKVSAAEIGRMLDLISTRMGAALKRQAQLNIDVGKVNERIGKLERQLEEERSKGLQPGGQVVVKFYAPQATTSQVRMSYVVQEAGWVPAYDLQVAKVGAPVNLTYKANIFQNTGINWDKVNLTLSTGNPSQGAQAPALSPWYVSISRPVSDSRRDRVSSADAGAYAYNASSVVSSPRQTNVSGRLGGGTLDGYVSTNAQGINTSYAINIPFSVPSDGKGHMVLVQSTKMAATYQYRVIPKLDSDAFLQARVTDWQNLNLLPGETNIYYENAYVGQGRIDLANIKDGLDVSLGRDRRIIVDRVEDQNNRGTAGVFGGSIQRSYGYTVNVRNTRAEAVKLEVVEQLPVSRDSDITLTDMKLANGVYDKDTGEVKWTLTLKPGESQSISYSYAVRYPKDANVVGL